MSYAQLATYAATLEADYDNDEESWEGSPFGWIRELPPRTKGAVGLRLAQSILADAGVQASRSGTGLSVGSTRIASRYSMEWTAGGFKFEQFKDDVFHFIFCLGVRPTAAYAWLIPKQEILVDGIWQERDNLTGQHRGQAAIDTFWLAVNPDNVPQWLQPFGGPVDGIHAVIQQYLV